MEDLPEMRDYRLVKLGLSLADIDAGSALLCDYLLAVDDAVRAGEEKAAKLAEVREARH